MDEEMADSWVDAVSQYYESHATICHLVIAKQLITNEERETGFVAGLLLFADTLRMIEKFHKELVAAGGDEDRVATISMNLFALTARAVIDNLTSDSGPYVGQMEKLCAELGKEWN